MHETCSGDGWRIVDVRAVAGSLYDVTLEAGDKDRYAYATLCVGNRAARGTHEPADWAVRVEWCPDDGARAWLQADEHEYAIGSTCVMGWAP